MFYDLMWYMYLLCPVTEILNFKRQLKIKHPLTNIGSPPAPPEIPDIAYKMLKIDA